MESVEDFKKAEKENINSKNSTIYDDQHKLYGIDKLQKTIISVSNQKKKFKKLWIKVNKPKEKTNAQFAFELDEIFR